MAVLEENEDGGQKIEEDGVWKKDVGLKDDVDWGSKDEKDDSWKKDDDDSDRRARMSVLRMVSWKKVEDDFLKDVEDGSSKGGDCSCWKDNIDGGRRMAG